LLVSDKLSSLASGYHLLGGVGVLVHQQQLNVLGVADEESLGELALDRKGLICLVYTFRPLGAMWRVLRLLP